MCCCAGWCFLALNLLFAEQEEADDEELTEEEKNANTIEKVDVDLSLSAYGNAQYYYQSKKQ